MEGFQSEDKQELQKKVCHILIYGLLGGAFSFGSKAKHRRNIKEAVFEQETAIFEKKLAA